MLFPRGTGKVVKFYADTIEGFFDAIVISFYDLDGLHSFLVCRDRNRSAVFIGSADVDNVFILQTQIADKDIRREVCSRYVSHMKLAVGIGQSAGNYIFHPFTPKNS